MGVSRPPHIVRVAAILGCWLFLATFARAGERGPVVLPARSLLTFTPIPLDRGDPARTRLGALAWQGGWRMESNDPRFGGVSALHVAGNGVAAASDTGALFRFELPGPEGGVVRVRVSELAVAGADPADKRDRDVEAMAAHGDKAWVALERRNAVGRFALPGWQAEASARPAAMRRWRGNRGAEAIVRLRDGRFLVFAEGEGASSPVVLFDSDPARAGARATRLLYRPPRGYRITDAAALPDGRLLLLNRRFAWLEGFSAILVVAGAPAPGEAIRGREIARFRLPVATDNMEALAVGREQGRTILWIASDDNFSPLQRSLLLKFILDEDAGR